MNTNEQQEGNVAKAIEKETSKIPSDIFLWTGLAIGAAAVSLYCMKKRHLALLIGQGMAPALLLGIYNKLVKQSGHDVDEPVIEKQAAPRKMSQAGQQDKSHVQDKNVGNEKLIR
jgi:hypothetical protein